MLDPHCVKTFLTTNVASHQKILRVTTQSLVPAVRACFSTSPTRIASQNPLKMADLSTGVGKGAIAIRNRMSRISSLVHLWRNLWDYVNSSDEVVRVRKSWFHHNWGACKTRYYAETFNAQYMRTSDSDLEQLYLQRVISWEFISFASLSCTTFEAGWGLWYINWDSPSACCYRRKFRGYVEWAWGCYLKNYIFQKKPLQRPSNETEDSERDVQSVVAICVRFSLLFIHFFRSVESKSSGAQVPYIPRVRDSFHLENSARKIS